MRQVLGFMTDPVVRALAPRMERPTMPPKILTMPQASDWKRVLETGMQFTELRRSQARALVADLVAQGHLARDQMASAVDEVLEMSRRRSEELRKVVQKEVQRQLGSLGLATKADIAALERRLTRASRETKKSGPAKKSGPSKKLSSKKAAKSAKAG
jgi:polyhydroxyalkanoate synthesis regulator phasin